MSMFSSELCSTIINIKGLPPKLPREKAVEIAQKKRLSLIRRKNTVELVELYYKPYLLARYRASVIHRGFKQFNSEIVEYYIVVDMLTGVGFEEEEFNEAELTQINVDGCRVLKSEINDRDALCEIERVITKFKSKMHRYGFKVVEDGYANLGLVYKPIWIIMLKYHKKVRYIGVDAIKGIKIL